ncbi:MAG: YbgC/FadM family acyl-CoA thioesterase [Rhodobacterales bacterium]|nr:YbgC/FadM family acyl-CoA thioesterase [Rhodobacterales bacterium]
MQPEHVLNVSVYYEDTDFSGLVYHANYLKYFERAREHFLGRAELVRLYQQDGIGFVVYKADLSFKEGAVFGDDLEIRTTVELMSDYRALFHQAAWKKDGKSPMVLGEIHLVCVDKDNKLIRLPSNVRAMGGR